MDGQSHGAISPFLGGWRVPGLPIKGCARCCSNRAQMCPQLSAIDVTAKTFFERLHLVLGLRKIAPWVNCPYAPTTPTIHSTTISRCLCNFFPRMTPHFFVIMIHQVILPSPHTLGGWIQVTWPWHMPLASQITGGRICKSGIEKLLEITYCWLHALSGRISLFLFKILSVLQWGA